MSFSIENVPEVWAQHLQEVYDNEVQPRIVLAIAAGQNSIIYELTHHPEIPPKEFRSLIVRHGFNIDNNDFDDTVIMISWMVPSIYKFWDQE